MNKLNSAIAYAKHGYYVLPMHGKQPLIKFANHPPLTVDQIKHYWSKWTDANVALRTVSFFVVDIDTKQGHHADGISSAKQLVKDGYLTPTLEQRTASGGRQLFYKKPQGVELKQVIGIRRGIDIKAQINNYVLVPPSTTSKGAYQWIDNGERMQAPPKKLIDLIQSSAKKATIKHPNFEYNPNKKWTGIVLDNLVAGAPEGQRNDYMTRLCGQMVHAGADDNTVWQLMQFANTYNTPPLGTNELEKILTSIIREELNKV